MAVSNGDTLVLHNRAYQLSAQQRLLLRLTLAFIVVCPLLVAAIIVVTFPGILDLSSKDWGNLLDSLWQELKKDSTELLLSAVVFVLALLQSAYVFLARNRERLILDASAMRYQSPLPAKLQWLRPSWKLQWSQVRSAYLRPSKILSAPQFITLVLDTGLHRRQIMPLQWVNPDDPPLGPAAARQWRTLGHEQVKSLLQLSPIVHYLANAGVEVKMDLAKAVGLKPFALDRNPHSLVALILFFTLIGYALADAVFVNQETYAERPFYEVYSMAGVLVAAVATAWLSRAQVPVVESIVVAVLLGGAFGAALYPGLLRLNQFSDSEGLQPYNYVLQRDLSLEPEGEKLPTIRFKRDLDYWSHFEIGSVHQIELRKGGLAFYQINMAPIHADMQKYYRDGFCGDL